MAPQNSSQPLPSDALQRIAQGEMPLNALLGLKPRDLEVMAALGLTLLRQGLTADARRIFEGLAAVEPGSYLGHAGLGAMALRESRLELAAAHLTTAAAANPPDPAVWANHGEVLLRLGLIDQATVSFQKALELDPQEKNPAANRARALIDGMMIVLGQRLKRA